MKKIGLLIVLVGIIGTIYYYREEISMFYLENFSNINKDVVLENPNEYSRDFTYQYVSKTDDFLVKEKSQLINIYYTIIDSGVDEFSFYCSNSYADCLNDVTSLSQNQIVLSSINSFVHPFNSFSSLETKYNTLGKITIIVHKSYTEQQQKEITNKMAEIIETEVNDSTDSREIIKKVHDYLINHTVYDSEKSDKNISQHKSNIAYGPLIEGYGLCGGYTDTMALFLDYYDIPNYKVISENHIWNAVYLDQQWYHLDATWDDPVMSDGSNVLEYNYFLISTEELEKLETNQHGFDTNIFSELS